MQNPKLYRKAVLNCVIISTLCIFIAYITLLFRHFHSLSPQPLFDNKTPASFVPYGFKTVTLTYPVVKTTSYPKGIISTAELSRDVEIPKPHEPFITGSDTKGQTVVYQKGHFLGIENEVRFMYMKDVFFTSDNVLIQDNAYVMLKSQCHPRYWPMFYQSPASITYNFSCYESAICLGHQHSSDFGHWFLEVLPAYAVLPKEILENSVIVLPYKAKYIVDGFELIGVKESQLVTGIEIPVFAKNFYTIDYVICGDLNRFLITKFRQLLMSTYNLGKKPPFRFVTYNRVNASRSIANYEELKHRLREKWPHIQWEEVPVFSSVEDQAKYFDTVKFLFCVHGSILANIIYMQDNTSVAVLEMEQWLLSFQWLSAYTGKYISLGRDAKISWRGLTPNVVDIDYVISIIEPAINAVTNATLE